MRSQNSLITQGLRDREGLTHGNGWGIAEYRDTLPIIDKQAWAAWHGEHFRKRAAQVYASTVVAHVRRATIGPPSIENTHPFVHGRWTFAHNGTIREFETIRPRLLDAMAPEHRNEIRGDTDSEHVFRYMLTLWSQQPEKPLQATVRQAVRQIVLWCRDVNPDARPSLNIMLTDGETFAGTRLNRSLWYLERDDAFICEYCGKSHVHHTPGKKYRSVDIASEPLTHEQWRGVPNGTVYALDPDMRIHIEPLSLPMGVADGVLGEVRPA